jgi:steroid delta-isomerase-like uncharacterized protein
MAETRIAVGLLALALASTTSARNGDGQRNKEIVRRMVEAVNARNFAALDEVVAPDVERHSAATPGVEVHTLEQLVAFLRKDLEGVPDAQQEIQSMVAEGDLVAVRALYRGTQTGPMGPFPPTGKRLEIPFLAFLRIANGKIAEMWVEWDNLSPLVGLGHLPPPGAPAASAASGASRDANKALARRWVEDVINGRNLDAIDAVYAEDYVHHGPGGVDLEGRDAARRFAAAILAASSDRHAVVEDQVAEGDRVVTRFRSTGHHTGVFRGLAPTGKLWTTTGIDISRIEKGRIVEDWEIVEHGGL